MQRCNKLTPQRLRDEDRQSHGLSSMTSEKADGKKNWFHGNGGSNSSLGRHMLTHNRETHSMKYSYCSEEFRSVNILKRHERGYSGDLVRCDFWSSVFLDILGNRQASIEEK